MPGKVTESGWWAVIVPGWLLAGWSNAVGGSDFITESTVMAVGLAGVAAPGHSAPVPGVKEEGWVAPVGHRVVDALALGGVGLALMLWAFAPWVDLAVCLAPLLPLWGVVEGGVGRRLDNPGLGPRWLALRVGAWGAGGHQRCSLREYPESRSRAIAFTSSASH